MRRKASVPNFLQRKFYPTCVNTKENFYKTLVRSHLKYASAARDAYTTKNIGVAIDNKLTWETHIDLISKKI